MFQIMGTVKISSLDSQIVLHKHLLRTTAASIMDTLLLHLVKCFCILDSLLIKWRLIIFDHDPWKLSANLENAFFFFFFFYMFGFP